MRHCALISVMQAQALNRCRDQFLCEWRFARNLVKHSGDALEQNLDLPGCEDEPEEFQFGLFDLHARRQTGRKH